MSTSKKVAKKKTKKDKSQGSGETRTVFKFPGLHHRVVAAVDNDNIAPWFNKKGNDGDAQHDYSTNIMGRFKCGHDCNDTVWSSKKVAIVIRGYQGNGYDAQVFNQRCNKCNGLGTFTVDAQSYVDRIAYRLRKWGGVPVEVADFKPREGLPHESSLCEGCKRGYCQKRSSW